MEVLSTKDVCDILGVSRAWVNTYLRQLGGAVVPENEENSFANARTVYYNESDLLTWLNQHAVCSRQTMWLNLQNYLPESELKKRVKKINRMPVATFEERVNRMAAERNLLEEILPADLLTHVDKVHPRQRGLLPWVPVDHRVSEIDELCTMKQLMKNFGHRSQEMMYRKIFSDGMIRVEVHGRTWYVPAPDRFTYELLIPANSFERN